MMSRKNKIHRDHKKIRSAKAYCKEQMRELIIKNNVDIIENLMVKFHDDVMARGSAVSFDKGYNIHRLEQYFMNSMPFAWIRYVQHISATDPVFVSMKTYFEQLEAEKSTTTDDTPEQQEPTQSREDNLADNLVDVSESPVEEEQVEV